MRIAQCPRWIRDLSLFGVIGLVSLFGTLAHAADQPPVAAVAVHQQMGKRIAQIVTIRPKAGMEAVLAERLHGLVNPTRRESGNLRYDLFEKEGGVWLVFEYWNDDVALAAHIAAPYSAAFLKDMGQFVEGAPEIMVFRSVDVAR